MKELSIEEKAKAYDEALERAKTMQEKSNGMILKKWLWGVFPKLKESEDERIRKELINYFIKGKEYLSLCSFSKEEILAWLEKQGEQKPITIDIDKMVSKYSHTKDGDFGLPVNCQIRAYRQGINDALSLSLGIKKQGEQKPYGQREECSDCQVNYAGECKGSCELKRNEQKPFDYENANIQQNDFAPKIEPKFKVGDWVVFKNKHQSIYQVEKIEDGYYILRHTHGGTFRICVLHNESLRHWTIQDAKDGDVLACPNDAGDRDVVFIFKNINSDEGWVFCFCASDANGCFCTNNDYVGNSNSTNISPATKEQRNLLFQKMHEAGYEWDVEKKELKKIENEIEIPFGAKDSELQEATYYIPKGFYSVLDGNKVIIKRFKNPRPQNN